MYYYDKAPINPRRPDGRLQVLSLGRVSTEHQDINMLDVQHGDAQKFVKDIWPGEFDLITLGEQTSGENALRESFVDACEMIEGCEIDLVVLFDLSKAGRLPRWMHQFVDLCVDTDTRLIVPADSIDTADPSYELNVSTATLVHGINNYHVRHRVRANAVDAFHKGGMVTKVPFGYIKLSPEDTAKGAHGPAGLAMAKQPEHEATIHRMVEYVLGRQSYEFIARWLNDQGVPTGAYARSDIWSGKMVRQFLRNPLLHGERVYGKTQIRRLRGSGKKSRKASEKYERKAFPKLAFLTPEEHGILIEEMDRRIAAHPRKQKAKESKRSRARSQTRCPGQLMTCGWCGNLFYWMGKGTLKCSHIGDADLDKCQNRVEVKPQLVLEHLRDLLLRVVEIQPIAKRLLIDAALVEYQGRHSRRDREIERIDSRLAALESERKNLARAIAKGLDAEEVCEAFESTKRKIGDLASRRDVIINTANDEPIDLTPEKVEANFGTLLLDLLTNSSAMNDLIRQVIVEFRIDPIRTVDTGRAVARATVTIDFGRYGRKPGDEPVEPDDSLDITEVWDLWVPPKHIEHFEKIVEVAMAHPDWSARKVGDSIGDLHRWAVRSALKLNEKMNSLGLTKPLVPVTDPDDVSRWRTKNGHKPHWDQT